MARGRHCEGDFDSSRAVRESNSSPRIEQASGLAEGFRDDLGTDWDFDENMALRYTLLDDEDLGIDYEDNLTTAVAVREELLANDVSSDILEATSTAMRTLLTSFGEYSIRPAV